MPSIRDPFPLSRPQIAYLFPEMADAATVIDGTTKAQKALRDDIFVFQYWPSQIQDSYEVDYATRPIPGGSHPLYQWIGGSGRTISFEAIFTSEIDDSDSSLSSLTSLTPSSRYTVNVAAALAALRSYQHPTYRTGALKGVAEPPKRLHLVLPKTNIGGVSDEILCFLKTCRVTIESCFPSGAIRVATVALEFIQTVQSSVGDPGATRVQFVGTSAFTAKAGEYRYRSP